MPNPFTEYPSDPHTAMKQYTNMGRGTRNVYDVSTHEHHPTGHSPA
jgi:hypothetical protein